jgi:hypothetical protein
MRVAADVTAHALLDFALFFIHDLYTSGKTAPVSSAGAAKAVTPVRVEVGMPF